MQKSQTTRRVVADCFLQARSHVTGKRLPSTNCAIVAKFRVEMSKSLRRDSAVINAIINELQQQDVIYVERCYDFFEIFFTHQSWTFLVCFLIVMELIAKREQEYLMDLDSEGGYEMDPTVMKNTAQYVDHITRLWIENNGWIGFFLIQFQTSHHWHENMIFQKILGILRKR